MTFPFGRAGWQKDVAPPRDEDRPTGLPPRQSMGDAIPETEVERLTHGICDALKFLPPPSESAGTAILRGLLIGTPHEGHSDDNWSNWRPR